MGLRLDGDEEGEIETPDARYFNAITAKLTEVQGSPASQYLNVGCLLAIARWEGSSIYLIHFINLPISAIVASTGSKIYISISQESNVRETRSNPPSSNLNLFSFFLN